jgi:hypothetical protein
VEGKEKCPITLTYRERLESKEDEAKMRVRVRSG